MQWSSILARPRPVGGMELSKIDVASHMGPTSGAMVFRGVKVVEEALYVLEQHKLKNMEKAFVRNRWREGRCQSTVVVTVAVIF